MLVLVAVPLRVWFGWSATWGYLFGLAMMTLYLVYLLLFVEGADDSRSGQFAPRRPISANFPVLDLVPP